MCGLRAVPLGKMSVSVPLKLGRARRNSCQASGSWLSLPQSLKKRCNRCRRLSRLCLLYQGNDGGANHCRIRELAHGGYMLRRGDAETHGNRQLGEWRRRSTRRRASEARLCCAPVMPTREMA